MRRVRVFVCSDQLKFWLGQMLLILFVLSQSSGNAWSQSTTKKKEDSFERELIEDNIAIAEWFDGVAEGLDLFLAGRKVTDRKNESSFRIETSTSLVESKGVSSGAGINANVRLPNLEEYWQLKFTSYDEQQESRAVGNSNLRQSQRQQNYGASVGVFRKLGNIRVAFQPRVELSDPLKVSHSLTFESVGDTKKFQVNPKLELYATPDKGIGAYTGLHFHFILSKIWSLTLINEGDYQEKLHLYSVGNGFSFGQYITSTSNFSYGMMFGSINRPKYHLETYIVSVAWNQIIYKKILDYSIIPHLDFARDRAFKGVPALTVNINLNF